MWLTNFYTALSLAELTLSVIMTVNTPELITITAICAFKTLLMVIIGIVECVHGATSPSSETRVPWGRLYLGEGHALYGVSLLGVWAMTIISYNPHTHAFFAIPLALDTILLFLHIMNWIYSKCTSGDGLEDGLAEDDPSGEFESV